MTSSECSCIGTGRFLNSYISNGVRLSLDSEEMPSGLTQAYFSQHGTNTERNVLRSTMSGVKIPVREPTCRHSSARTESSAICTRYTSLRIDTAVDGRKAKPEAGKTPPPSTDLADVQLYAIPFHSKLPLYRLISCCNAIIQCIAHGGEARFHVSRSMQAFHCLFHRMMCKPF